MSATAASWAPVFLQWVMMERNHHCSRQELLAGRNGSQVAVVIKCLSKSLQARCQINLNFFGCMLSCNTNLSLAGDPLNVCPSALHSCDCSAGIMKWPAAIDGLVTPREGQPGGGPGWTALLWSQTQAVQAGLQIEL